MLDLLDKSRDWLIDVDRLELLHLVTEPRLQLLLAVVFLLSLIVQLLLEVSHLLFESPNLLLGPLSSSLL